MRTKWISHPTFDLSFIFVGILVFGVVHTLGNHALAHTAFGVATLQLIALMATVILDSGHVFLTYIRIFKEIRLIWLLTISFHLFLFFFFYFYQSLSISYLWHFVVYATLFHFIRQFYGVLRWYIALNKNPNHNAYLDTLFYLLIFLPLFCLHFRPDLPTLGYYAKSDTFMYPSQNLYEWFRLFNFAALAGWIMYEAIFFFRTKSFELPRVLYIFSTAALFNLVGFYALDASEVILPIVSAHGLQYYVLSAKMINKVHFPSRKIVGLLSIVLVGAGFGYLNFLGEKNLDFSYGYLSGHDAFNASLVAFVLTPLFIHYVFDMFMWKRFYLRKITDSGP